MGDIIFLSKLFKEISSRHERIIFPVFDVYSSWISDYLTFPDNFSIVGFSNKFKYSDIYFNNRTSVPTIYKDIDLTHYPLMEANHNSKARDYDWVGSKYKTCNIGCSDWHDYANIKRNYQKEKELEQLLSLPSEYNIVCDIFKPEGNANINIEIDNDLPCVYIKPIKGFTSFDWMGVIQKAKNIYFVDTSFVWIVEKMDDLACDNMFIYPRNYELMKSNIKENKPVVNPSYCATSHFFKKPWTFVFDQYMSNHPNWDVLKTVKESREIMDKPYNIDYRVTTSAKEFQKETKQNPKTMLRLNRRRRKNNK